MKWRVVLEPDLETGDGAVWCPELPGCACAGGTEAEALTNIREAIELYGRPDPLRSHPQGECRQSLRLGRSFKGNNG